MIREKIGLWILYELTWLPGHEILAALFLGWKKDID